MTELILRLEDCSPELAQAVGGKAVGLAALIARGLDVPDGFVVTTHAYRAALGAHQAELEALAADCADDWELSGLLRKHIESQPLPDTVSQAVLAAYHGLGEERVRVAVRSSATAEDLADASFAGQQDTYLGVAGDDSLLERVVQCWSSLFTEQAIGYRRKLGVPVTDLAMAVVIQRMVAAEAGGVMLTLDPVSGDRSCVFISAAHGLGEGVAKGDVECDSIWVDKATLAVVRREDRVQSAEHRYVDDTGRVERVPMPRDRGSLSSISDEEAVDLARAGIEMERTQGVAQDVEWAIELHAGERIVRLLQTRPETVWSNQSDSSNSSTLHGVTRASTTWTTTNVGESVPGVPTPLGWSMWSVAGELAMRSAFVAVGALSAGEAGLPADPRDWMLGIFHGRASLNVSLLCEWAERVPATDPVAMCEQVFSAVPPGYVPRSQWRYYPRVLAKSGLPMFRIRRMVENDRRDAEAFRANTLPELSGATPERTAELFELAIDLHRRCLSTQTLLTLTVCQPIVDRLLASAASVGISGEELMAGYGGHDETAAVADMWAVSRGRLDMETFLARHGFHAWQEGELSSHSWREDPTPVRKLIAGYASRSDDEDPAQTERSRREKRLLLEREYLAALPAHKRPRGRALIALAKTFVPPRGVAKGSFVQVLDVVRAAARRLGEHYVAAGELMDREDVFYLVLEEIRGGLPADIRKLVAERRAERSIYQGMEIPTVFTGEPIPSAVVAVSAERTILGTGASPGVVEGRARVVTTPDQSHVEPGEILVARDTDPSWAALMFLSAGLVADIGGVMSHTAIVARELRLPCVVNAGNASRSLRTGDLIRINGTAGSIEILEKIESGEQS